MALVQATLKSELLKLFDQDSPTFVGFPATVADAATNFGNAYNTYAATAQDVSGDPLTSSNVAGFISTLASSLPDAASGSPTTTAQAFGSAFVSFWTGATFATAIPPAAGVGGTGLFSKEVTSTVTAAVPTALSSLLEPIFATPPTAASTADAQADTIAAAFHAATTSGVTVVIAGLDTTPPPPAGSGPLPITNTGTVFQ